MVTITLSLKGPLKRYGPDQDKFAYSIDSNSISIKDLIKHLGIAASSVSFAAINNEKTELDTLLEGGEKVTIYPRVVGG